MGPKRKAGGGNGGTSRAGGGNSVSELGAEKRKVSRVVSPASAAGQAGGCGPIAASSMPPPPPLSSEPRARGDARLPSEGAICASGSGGGGGGGGGGDDAARPTLLFAELRRVSTDAPSTATLPDQIALPQPGDFEPVSFGRHRGNNVQLDCPRVPSLLSRQHAEIRIDAQGVHSVTDKDTLNGTYLNGNLIPKGPCPLQHGDVLAFGGPANVLRDNNTLRNSFRFEYRQPLSLEQWKSQVEGARQYNVAHAGEVAGLASAAEDEEQRRPAKRLRRTGDSTEGGGPIEDGVPSTTPTTGNGVDTLPFPAVQFPLAGGVCGSSSEHVRVQSQSMQSKQSTLPTQPQSTQSTLPTQPSSQLIPIKPEVDNDSAAKVRSDDLGTAPLGHRTPGTTVVKLSRRDLVAMQRVASKMAKRSQDFLCNGLSETGKSLAETVVPLNDHDEAALMDTIAENSKDMKTFSSLREALTMKAANSQNAVDGDTTQSTQEYDMPPFPSKTAELAGVVVPFLRRLCEDALEIHVTPTGLVSFGLKFLSVSSVWDSEVYSSKEKTDKSIGTTFRRGDLIAEAVALALWPQQQIGWEGKRGEEIDTSENCVFASSISEIDGHGCDIGGSGCQAIAEGILAPRQTVDGVWVFNECLRGLALGKNPRLGDVGASALAAALKPRPCFDGAMTFNKTLTVLDLSSCGIGSEGAMAISDALKMVPSRDGDWSFPSNLRALRLSGNRIESKGARAIAELLGPKENKKTGKWTFNPTLAIIDVSDNFSGMNDLVAEAFAKALRPRTVKPSKHSGDEGDLKQVYSINVALLELHLCGHAFRNGVQTILDSLDPKSNGSDGAAGATVRVVFEHPGRDGASEMKSVVDSDGNGYELVLPITTGCAAERRFLSHWQWRPWNTPLSTSRDDPSVAPEAALASSVQADLAGWHKALLEDHHPNGSTQSWSVGFAFRNVLLQRMEGDDSILSGEPGSVAAGLPQWLDDELRCVICTDVFVTPYSINGCGHTFCHDCISHWFSTRSTQCPICRHRLQVPTSVALTPCHMAQRLLDHYVLPYLPSKDVEARRVRAREVRDNAAVRAAEARRASSAAGEEGRAGSFAASAAAAIAMVAGGGGTASLRVSGASNISALQQMINMYTRRALLAAQEARTRAANNPAEQPTHVSMHEAMAQSLRSAQEVLRNLQESRRRREEQLTGVMSDQSFNVVSTDTAPAAAAAGAAGPLSAAEALLIHRRTTEAVEQPDWKAVSSSVVTATPCRHCRIVIPPRFLRMKRTVTVSGVETCQYFHANYDCLRTVHYEIRAAPDIAALAELSEQERRVVSALRAVITSPTETGRGRNRNLSSQSGPG